MMLQKVDQLSALSLKLGGVQNRQHTVGGSWKGTQFYLPNTVRTPKVPRAIDIITAKMETPPVAKT